MIISLKLDLPSPPQWLLNRIWHCVTHRDLDLTSTNKTSLSSGYSARSVKKDGTAYASRFQKRYVLGADAELWISEITESQANLPTVAINEGSTIYHGPHVDAGRSYALTYMIEPGGSNVKTSWWKKAKQPTIIDQIGDNVRFTCDYDHDLHLINQIQLKSGEWYLYNTRIIHSVEDCESTRISLQMNVDNPYKLLKYASVDQ